MATNDFSLIQFKKATTIVWLANKDVVLEQAEPAVEFTVDGKILMKLGDGLKTWEQLPYISDGSAPTDLSSYLKKDLSNLGTDDLDRALIMTNAYKNIEKRFPQYFGLRATEKKVNQAFDFATTTDNIIHIVYTINIQNNNISQNLPDLASMQGKIIILEVEYGSGINSGGATISPVASDTINGERNPIILNTKGIGGILLATQTTYDWIPYDVLQDNKIVITDGIETLKANTLEFSGSGVTISKKGDDGVVVNITGSGGVSTIDHFTELKDVPDSYVGQAHKYLQVNGSENAISFASIATDTGEQTARKLESLTGNDKLDANALKNLPTSSSTFVGLTDTPSNYTSANGKLLSVNSGATGVEFIDAPDINNETKYFTDPSSDTASRLRYDILTKTWRFERKEGGSWVEKFKVGESAIVDVVKLIAGAKPTNIPADELAIYNKNIQVDGNNTIRPYFVLPDGKEYSLVVHDEITDKVVFRASNGTLKEIPILDISNKLNTNLDNVIDADFLKKGKEVGFAENNLEDVELPKISEKVTASGVLTPLQNEINRLKTDISTNNLPTYAYRGSTIPTIPTDKQKAYYLSFTALASNTQQITLPANADEGTIFSINNNDRTNAMTLIPSAGETIDSSTSSKTINPSSILFLVKKGSNWVIGFDGYMPNDLSIIVDGIKVALVGQLNTIDEITAQLKDRLHLFSEIQAEFKDELHTYIDLMMAGFEQMTFAYGISENNNIPLNNGWIIARNLLGKDLSYTNMSITTPQYVMVTLPYVAEKTIQSLLINDVVAPVEKYDYLLGNMREIIYITKGTFNVATGISVKFKFIEITDDGGLTYDEIETQFATKLHTFAEIGAEFSTKLHTFDELEQNRFLRDWIAYGTSNSGAVPNEGDNSWIFSYMRLAGTGQITKLLQPPAYIIVKVPKMYDLLITEARLNGSLGMFSKTERTENGASYVYYVSKNVSEVSNVSITFDLFSNVPVTPYSLSVGNDVQTFSNINDIDFINADVTQQPAELNKVTVVPYVSVEGTNDSINKIKKIKFSKSIVDLSATDANIAEVTPQIGVMQNGGQEKFINSLEVEYPLRFTFNESEQRGEVSVDNVFDFKKPEGMFLKGRAITYLKNFDGTVYQADIEHFTKEVYEGVDLTLTGNEIQIKRPMGLYNGFPKVPLVSYGRMAFEGFAPRAGFIEIGLRDITTKKTLLGSYGETISRTRSYLANEKLYYLDFFSVFEVDFDIKNVELYIKHSFGQDYDLKISDDVDGGSCLMLQFVSQDYKTGVALDEVRGQYNLILPFEIFELTAGQPLAGYSLELNGVIPRTDVTGVFNRQGFCEIGTADKEAFFEMNSTGLNITAKDDSTPSYAYISLMLNTELTQVFKNDNLILTVNLTLKDVMSALDIIPITWTGIANEIPKGIVGSIPDNFIPVPTDAGWTFDNANAHFIQMDVSNFNPRTISVDFAVPQSAVNFGVLVVPHAVANAMKIHIQGLNFAPKVTDVAPMLKPIVRLGDSYLFNSVRHGQYSWDFPPTTSTDKIQGLVLGTNPTQIPVSKRVYGDAAIKLIKINGLNYHVMEFASAGKAKIDSTWTLTRPKSHFVHPSHTAHVYFALATPNGSGGYNLSKITQSEATHSIDVEYPTVVQVTTPTFTYDVVAGTILVAMGTCDTTDDVYVAMSHSGDRPIVVDVEYTESVSGSSSDAPIGSLYTQSDLGAVWEIKTADDGHVESLKVGDLEENTVHHITRDNLNLNDFTIVDGVVNTKISMSDIISRLEYLLRNTNEVEFVKNGVVESDQTKYKMQIDVATGQTKIINI